MGARGANLRRTVPHLRQATVIHYRYVRKHSLLLVSNSLLPRGAIVSCTCTLYRRRRLLESRLALTTCRNLHPWLCLAPPRD